MMNYRRVIIVALLHFVDLLFIVLVCIKYFSFILFIHSSSGVFSNFMYSPYPFNLSAIFFFFFQTVLVFIFLSLFYSFFIPSDCRIFSYLSLLSNFIGLIFSSIAFLIYCLLCPLSSQFTYFFNFQLILLVYSSFHLPQEPRCVNFLYRYINCVIINLVHHTLSARPYVYKIYTTLIKLQKKLFIFLLFLL